MVTAGQSLAFGSMIFLSQDTGRICSIATVDDWRVIAKYGCVEKWFTHGYPPQHSNPIPIRGLLDRPEMGCSKKVIPKGLTSIMIFKIVTLYFLGESYPAAGKLGIENFDGF